jgi:hypothetical protein
VRLAESWRTGGSALQQREEPAMRRRDPDFESWYFVPLDPYTESRFRRWNIVIIAILGFLILGLFLTAVIPNPQSATGTPTATKTSLHHCSATL